MGKQSILAMRTDRQSSDSVASDLQDLKNAAINLANHTIKLGGLGFGTAFLEWFACAAAIIGTLCLDQHSKKEFLSMGKASFLAMRTDQQYSESIASDLQDLKNAAKNLANHAIKLGGIGFGTTFLQWFACASAIYLLILDKTNWKTNLLTGLLVPYIFFSLPTVLFNIIRGEIGKWIALVAVVLRLFFPSRFPDWLEMPGSLILLTLVAPSLFASYVRGNWIGVAMCLVIACYLLQEHIRASGGFRNAFTKANGISNTIGIVLLFIYPAWALVLDIF